MIYVIDTNSFREIDRYYPDIFPSFWQRFNAEVAAGDIKSVSEVHRELQRYPEQNVNDWANANSKIFYPPTADETNFVGAIFTIPHFRQLISAKSQQMGLPVADPFLIAAAHCCGGTVITEEKSKPQSAKIPNVCGHFGVRHMNFKDFLTLKGWKF
jgi:hypothetical protein